MEQVVSPQRAYELRYPDRARARGRINGRIRRGKMQPANEQFCVDCDGWASEYDHALGYATDYVEPVCRPCHYDREKSRRRLLHVILRGHNWEEMPESTPYTGCHVCAKTRMRQYYTDNK